MSLVADRYAKAIVSSNLRASKEFATSPSDVEVITTAGTVLRRQRDGVASAVHRARANATNPALLRKACAALMRMADGLIPPGMPLEKRHEMATDSALLVLDRFLRPMCPMCRGVKFEKIIGTRCLSDTVCPLCHGGGLRAWQNESKFTRDLHMQATQRLEIFERRVARRMGWQ